jgi:hypothetical protein
MTYLNRAAASFLALLISASAWGATNPTPGSVQLPAAGPQPVYAVLSLIGDELSVIASQLKVGDAPESNFKRAVPIEEPVFDTIAIRATIDAVRRGRPGAEMAALNTRSPVLFAKQRQLFDEQNGVMTIPEAIIGALAQQGATHLILITKYRDETRVLIPGAPGLAARMEGLGFFLNGAAMTTDPATGSTGRGYISPFTFFQIALIELPSRKVLKTRVVSASEPFSAASTPSGDDPWAALTSAQKIAAIEALLTREIARAIPLMFDGLRR